MKFFQLPLFICNCNCIGSLVFCSTLFSIFCLPVVYPQKVWETNFETSSYSVEEDRAASKSPHWNLAIFFLLPSKQFPPISLKIQLLVKLCNIWIMNIEWNIFTVLKKDLKNVSEMKCPFTTLKSKMTLQRLKQEWHKSPALGLGKQTAKTWFGLEK